MEARKPNRHDLKWSKTNLFFVFHLHLFGSLIMLQNVSDSLFFAENDVEGLPMVRFVMAAIMLPLTILYDRISARDPENRTFEPMVVIATGIVGIGIGLRFVDPALGGFALMVASPIVQAFLLAEFWNFANRYFTIRESRRTFPMLFGAASLGGVAAGLAVSNLASVVSTENLLYAWLLINLFSIAFIKTVRASADPVAERTESRKRRTSQRRRNIFRRLADAVTAQPLVTAIVGLSFLGTVVLFLAEYVYYDIFSAAYTNTDELTEFLGFWSAVSSGINFILSFLLLPRLAAALGVRNVTLVQPALAIAVFIGLFTAPALAMGVVAYLVILSRNVIEETNEKFLYKGLSSDVAQVVRGRAEGAVKPLAAVLAAVLLFLFGDSASALMNALGTSGSSTIVAAVGIVLAVAYLGIALLARTAYPRAIVERIRTRTFDTRDAALDLPLEGSESNALLQQQLASDDAEIVRFAAEYLYAADPDLALKLVLERLRDAPQALQAELLELLARWAGDVTHARLHQEVEPFLDAADVDTRATALRVWAQLPDVDMKVVLDALHDQSPEVRREAIAALCTHWDLMHVARGAGELDALLNSDDPEERTAAVSVLGRLRDRRHLRMLTPCLEDRSPRVRVAAAMTIDERVDPSCDFLVPELVDQIDQREHAVRIHLLNALLRIGEPAAGPALLAAAEGIPVGLQQRSAHFLSRHSEVYADTLEESLRNPSRRHGERVMAAQALTLAGRPHRPMLVEVARNELTEAYRTLIDEHLLSQSEFADHDAMPLLELALNDRRREALELVVEIVGFASEHPDFDTIRTYCFSEDPVARAYAIEALENLADRTLFDLLLPFLTVDPNDELDRALGALGAQLGLDRQDDDVLARRIRDPHPWVRACALHVATRLGHSDVNDVVAEYIDDPDPIVRETAHWARARVIIGAVT